MKMFINMTKPSPVIAALAEMQGKFYLFVKKGNDNVTECQWMSLNVIECHWVALNVTGCHWMSFNVTECH